MIESIEVKITEAAIKGKSGFYPFPTKEWSLRVSKTNEKNISFHLL